MVLDSYSSFSPELGDLVERFFDERWIDAPVRPNKRGGAFCAYTVPSVHPYVLLNYTYRRRDVLTLAHELGHGVHAALGAGAGRVPHGDAADAGRDRERVRRVDRLRPPAREGTDAGVAAGAAGGEHRGVDRDGVPPGGHEPLRGLDPHRAGAPRASWPWSASASCGASPRRSCSATRSRSPRATARGGPTCRTSSARPATSTPTPTGSCWRWPSTAATARRATSFVPAYLELLAAGGSRSPEELGAHRRHRPRRPRVLGPRARPRRAPARGRRGGGPRVGPGLAPAPRPIGSAGCARSGPRPLRGSSWHALSTCSAPSRQLPSRVDSGCPNTRRGEAAGRSCRGVHLRPGSRLPRQPAARAGLRAAVPRLDGGAAAGLGARPGLHPAHARADRLLRCGGRGRGRLRAGQRRHRACARPPRRPPRSGPGADARRDPDLARADRVLAAAPRHAGVPRPAVRGRRRRRVPAARPLPADAVAGHARRRSRHARTPRSRSSPPRWRPPTSPGRC